MVKSKKGSVWIWIIIFLILILIGVGIYFLLSNGDTTLLVNTGNNAGDTVLRPPALPSN